MVVYAHSTVETDAAEVWVPGRAYLSNVPFSIRIPAAGGPFVDSQGKTATIGALYNAAYPTDQTSGAAFDVAEALKIEFFNAVDETPANDRVFADNTTVAPAATGEPTIAEIEAWATAATHTDKLVVYTGDDAAPPAGTITHIWSLDNSGTATLLWQAAPIYGEILSERIGTTIELSPLDENGAAITDDAFVARGILPLTPGYRATGAAAANPKFSQMHPWLVSGNDLLVPSNTNGIVWRNLGSLAAAFGTFQDDGTAVNGLRILKTQVNWDWTAAHAGAVSKAGNTTTSPVNNSQSLSSTDSETRMKNYALRFGLILDSYASRVMVTPDAALVTQDEALPAGDRQQNRVLSNEALGRLVDRLDASAGQYVGEAVTYAALNALTTIAGSPAPGEPISEGDWGRLRQDDIGTGTVLAPQYRAGIYRVDAAGDMQYESPSEQFVDRIPLLSQVAGQVAFPASSANATGLTIKHQPADAERRYLWEPADPNGDGSQFVITDPFDPAQWNRVGVTDEARFIDELSDGGVLSLNNAKDIRVEGWRKAYVDRSGVAYTLNTASNADWIIDESIAYWNSGDVNDVINPGAGITLIDNEGAGATSIVADAFSLVVLTKVADGIVQQTGSTKPEGLYTGNFDPLINYQNLQMVIHNGSLFAANGPVPASATTPDQNEGTLDGTWVRVSNKADSVGNFVGSADTHAGLPAIDSDGGVLDSGDWSVLTVNDVGSGTATAPEFPSGGYIWDGTAWTFGFAISPGSALDVAHYVRASFENQGGNTGNGYIWTVDRSGGTAVTLNGASDQFILAAGYTYEITYTPIQGRSNAQFINVEYLLDGAQIDGFFPISDDDNNWSGGAGYLDIVTAPAGGGPRTVSFRRVSSSGNGNHDAVITIKAIAKASTTVLPELFIGRTITANGAAPVSGGSGFDGVMLSVEVALNAGMQIDQATVAATNGAVIGNIIPGDGSGNGLIFVRPAGGDTDVTFAEKAAGVGTTVDAVVSTHDVEVEIVNSTIVTGHDLTAIDKLLISFTDTGTSARPWQIGEIDVQTAVENGTFFVWSFDAGYVTGSIEDAATGTIRFVDTTRAARYIRSWGIQTKPVGYAVPTGSQVATPRTLTVTGATINAGTHLRLSPATATIIEETELSVLLDLSAADQILDTITPTDCTVYVQDYGTDGVVTVRVVATGANPSIAVTEKAIVATVSVERSVQFATRGSSVTFGDFRFRIPNSGNHSLQFSTVTGTISLTQMNTYWGASAGGASNNQTSSTSNGTWRYVRSAWHFTATDQHQTAEFVANGWLYQVHMTIASGYVNNRFAMTRWRL